MSVTAIVIGHRDQSAVERMIASMRSQTNPPDEIIVTVCCMSVDDLDADMVLLDRHVEDTGQRLCDYGLRLASSDYVVFASCDDEYDPRFIEVLSAHDTDIIHCDFWSHLAGGYLDSGPGVGGVTRGCYLVKTDIGKRVGYNHRTYDGDGRFIEDLVAAGATLTRVTERLYRHL